MQLGRSERFLNRLLPAVRERFGDWPAFSQDNFVAWNQQVKPGFIRVDADEVSYPAHVILRYEIERALIHGEIEEMISRRCGTRKCSTGWAVDHRQLSGWLHAGYSLDRRRIRLFPFLYPGRDVCRAVDGRGPPRAADINRDIEEGDFSALFDWLRQNLWQHGSRFTTSQLIQQATGEDLDRRYFREHLTTRYL